MISVDIGVGRRGAAIVVVVLGLLLGGSISNAGARTITRGRCGRVEISAVHLRAKVRVVRGPNACSTARRVIEAAFTAEARRRHDFNNPTWGIGWKVLGWGCTTGLASSQTFCRQGAHRVDGSLRTDDGWQF